MASDIIADFLFYFFDQRLITRFEKTQVKINIFSTIILASHSFLQFVAYKCRSALVVASNWFVLPI